MTRLSWLQAYDNICLLQHQVLHKVAAEQVLAF